MLDVITVIEDTSRRIAYNSLLDLEITQTLHVSVRERYNIGVGRYHSRAGPYPLQRKKRGRNRRMTQIDDKKILSKI